MSNKWYMGIDLGYKGAVALIGDEKEIQIYDYRKDMIVFLDELMDDFNIVGVAMEDSFTKRGISSIAAKTTFRNMGMYEGLLKVRKMPYLVVHPKVWQTALLANIPNVTHQTDIKKKVADSILQVYPDIDMLGPRGALKDGRTDAAAVAWWRVLQSGRLDRPGSMSHIEGAV